MGYSMRFYDTDPRPLRVADVWTGLRGFSRHAAARNMFLAMGAFSVAAGLQTETTEMP